MKKIYFFILALGCAAVVAANEATIIEPQTTIETDELGVDTIIIGEDTLFFPRFPEPIHLDLSSSPRKATLAEPCRTDSIVGLDNGAYASKTEYEYDEAGHTIGETKYKWVNGVKTGISKYWKKYTGSTATTTVNYKWNATKEDWDGKDSTQYLYYPNGKMKSNAKYVWDNNAWRYSTLVEYEYDAANRETLTCNSSWSTAAGALAYTTKREHEYDGSGRTLVDASWKYSNGAWIGTGMSKWEYYANGQKKVEEAYSGWENNNWKGIANGRATYEYNAAGKVTKKITYTWTAGAWVEATKEETQYDGSNVSDLAQYSWKNGAWSGTSRDSTTWTGGKKTEEIKLIWSDNTWKLSTNTQKVYSGSNQTEQIPLKWDGTKWIGNGTKWVKTFVLTNKVETQTNYSWITDKWVETTKDSTKWINSSLSESVSSYKWNEGVWDGTKKVKNTYNAKNKPLSNETLAWGGSETNWRDSLHTVYQYADDNTTEILKVNAKKVGDDWQAIDSTKREIEYITVAGQKKTKSDFSSKWTATSGKWTGTGTKYKYEYDANANVILSVTHTFKNGAWVYKDSALYAYKNNKSTQKLLDETWSYNSNTMTWKGNHKYIYDFNDAGLPILNAYYNAWDTDRKEWIGDQKNEKKYDGSTLISNLYFNWNNSLWDFVGSSRIDYNQRDAAGNITEQVDWVSEISGDTWKWVQSEKTEKEFDPSKGEVYSLTSEWSGTNWCSTAMSESTYDNDADAKLRYTYDEEYKNCETTPFWKAESQYYYSCDTYWNIRFVDWDGTELSSQKVLNGALPKTPGKQTREMDQKYTYEFTGWGEKIVAATENKTYTAQYEATLRKYTVTYYDEDGTSILDTQKNVEYGTTPTYGGPEPTKASTDQYTYAFSQWGDNGVKAVEGDTSYVAHYTPTLRQYTVTFANYDDKPLQSSSVDYGTTPAYTGETPTKAGDAEYSYVFSGWSPEIVSVTGAATYTAQFTPSKNQYTVKFYADEAKENLLYSNKFDFGTMPEYTGDTPTKAGDAQYSYTFSGWGETGTKNVTGDTAYVAQFTPSVNQYTVTFNNYDNTPLQSSDVAYGTTPEYTGETPVKAGDAEYSYVFSGWSPEITAVTGAATYTAQFTPSKNQYAVTFEVKGNSALSHTIDNVPYGTLVNDLVAAVKAALGGDTFEDDDYIYTFVGLENVSATDIVTGDATYYVLYSAEPKTTTGFGNIEQSPKTVKIIENGVLYILREGKKYTMQGEVVD